MRGIIMKKIVILLLSALILLPLSVYPETLQEAYNNAIPSIGYNRLLELDPGTVYTGGITIFSGIIGIRGNGAIIDLQGGSISVAGEAQLEIDGCIIINGANGLLMQDQVSAYVTHCTFYGNQVGISYMVTGGLLEVSNSILAFNTQYGLTCDEGSSVILHYLDAYQNAQGDYMKWCSG